MGILPLLIIFVESYIPSVVIRAFLYGKSNIKIIHPILAKIEIPKK